MQDNVDIVEQPLTDHIDLSATAFLGRRSVEPDRAGCAGLLEPVPDCERRA